MIIRAVGVGVLPPLRSALERVCEVGEDEYLEAPEARAAIRPRSQLGWRFVKPFGERSPSLRAALPARGSVNPLDELRAYTSAIEVKDPFGEFRKVSARKDAKDSIGGWTEPYLSIFVLFLRISRWKGP
jgi:hypothetical protein